MMINYEYMQKELCNRAAPYFLKIIRLSPEKHENMKNKAENRLVDFQPYFFNALGRATAISTDSYEDAKPGDVSFNALHRAIAISTEEKINGSIGSIGVSMPFNGQSPFLHHYRHHRHRHRSVSMPFNGQSPFLPTVTMRTMDSLWVFQCPSTGNRHFYVEEALDEETLNAMFQCPSTGNRHFYFVDDVKTILSLALFQCPSTGNRHFYHMSVFILIDDVTVSMPFNGQSPFLPSP